MNKKITLLVVSSLLLNILLGGLVLGHIYHHIQKRGMPPQVETMIQALPPAKQEEFRQAMERVHEENNASFAQMRDARKAIADSLQAEPFNPLLYQERVNSLNMLQTQQRQRMADTIKNMAEHWDAKERKILAAMLKYPPRPGKPCKDDETREAPEGDPRTE